MQGGGNQNFFGMYVVFFLTIFYEFFLEACCLGNTFPEALCWYVLFVEATIFYFLFFLFFLEVCCLSATRSLRGGGPFSPLFF
jgi:hypothetical protein